MELHFCKWQRSIWKNLFVNCTYETHCCKLHIRIVTSRVQDIDFIRFFALDNFLNQMGTFNPVFAMFTDANSAKLRYLQNIFADYEFIRNQISLLWRIADLYGIKIHNVNGARIYEKKSRSLSELWIYAESKFAS